MLFKYAKLFISLKATSKQMWLISYMLHAGKSSLNVILEYARNVAKGCPEQNPINRAIRDVETKCETLLHQRENSKVRAR